MNNGLGPNIYVNHQLRDFEIPGFSPGFLSSGFNPRIQFNSKISPTPQNLGVVGVGKTDTQKCWCRGSNSTLSAARLVETFYTEIQNRLGLTGVVPNKPNEYENNIYFPSLTVLLVLLHFL
jgi:hypothetical protein